MSTLLQTPANIKNSSNFRCGLELTDIDFNVYLTHISGDKFRYTVFFKDKLLFSGDDVKPSPLHDKYSLESIVSLLGFLTLAPGDTDAEYFKKYTKQQLAWCQSITCQELSAYVCDYKNKEKSARSYFDQNFIDRETLFLYPYQFNLDNLVCRRAYKQHKGWDTVNIVLNEKQKQNFLKLFGYKCRTNTWNKLKRAIEDNFRSLKTNKTLERVFFIGNDISYTPNQHYTEELQYVRMLILKSY